MARDHRQNVIQCLIKRTLRMHQILYGSVQLFTRFVCGSYFFIVKDADSSCAPRLTSGFHGSVNYLIAVCYSDFDW